MIRRRVIVHGRVQGSSSATRPAAWRGHAASAAGCATRPTARSRPSSRARERRSSRWCAGLVDGPRGRGRRARRGDRRGARGAGGVPNPLVAGSAVTQSARSLLRSRTRRAPRVSGARPESARWAQLSRSQLLVYGAVAVTLLLVGARWIRSGDQPGSDGRRGELPSASDSSGSAGGSFGVDPQGGEDVVVDVAGAVRKPGRLQAAGRLARQRRGRSAPAAPPRGPSVEAINLAARLGDGQQVVVPAKAPGGVGGHRRERRRG